MITFKEIEKENQVVINITGSFTYDFSDTIEIAVSYYESKIIITERVRANSLDIKNKESYFGLYGSMGYPSIEDKFNEIIKELL